MTTIRYGAKMAPYRLQDGTVCAIGAQGTEAVVIRSDAPIRMNGSRTPIILGDCWPVDWVGDIDAVLAAKPARDAALLEIAMAGSRHQAEVDLRGKAAPDSGGDWRGNGD